MSEKIANYTNGCTRRTVHIYRKILPAKWTQVELIYWLLNVFHLDWTTYRQHANERTGHSIQTKSNTSDEPLTPTSYAYVKPKNLHVMYAVYSSPYEHQRSANKHQHRMRQYLLAQNSNDEHTQITLTLMTRAGSIRPCEKTVFHLSFNSRNQQNYKKKGKIIIWCSSIPTHNMYSLLMPLFVCQWTSHVVSK